jgi:hypothetical protein
VRLPWAAALPIVAASAATRISAVFIKNWMGIREALRVISRLDKAYGEPIARVYGHSIYLP